MSDETDIRTVEVTEDAENNQMELIAKMAAQVLSKHYPAHLWAVGWAPGRTLVIKNMAMDARYGFTIDAARASSINELEHAVMLGGGELLERMGMRRGQWNGEFADKVDGIPDRG